MRYFLTNGNLKSLFIILCIALSAAVEAQMKIYVAPNGDDANDGAETSPLATFAGAREKIRAIKTASGLPAGGITVYFRGGTYYVTETTEFTADDSGTAQSPIIYKAYPNETPVFTGGSYISGSDFVRVTELSMLSRLDRNARDKVVCYDLFAHGFTLDELDYAKYFWRHGNLQEDFEPQYHPNSYLSPRMQVFINDDALYLARYPNKTEGIFVENPYNKYLMITATEVIETGLDPVTENYNGRPSQFKTHADRIKSWKNFDDVVISGMPGYEFFMAEIVAEKIDTATMTVTLRNPGNSGILDRGRYAFTNVFEELDTPGEYYISRDGVLYLYPTTDMQSATVKISRFEENFMIKTEGASYLTFSALTFELTKSSVIHILGGENCTVENCVVKNYGGDGVRLGWGVATSGTLTTMYGTESYEDYLKEPVLTDNGLNHKIAGCTFLNTGRRAALIASGNTVYRQHGNAVFENNVVKHSGLIGSCYFSGIVVEGCGITVKNNAFFYCRGQAINGNIVDTEIINNEFCDSPCDMAEDTGTIYINYGNINDGVKIRYNYFHDVTNRGYQGYGFGFAGRITGVYYDNGQPFKDFSYNVIYNAPYTNLYAGTNEPIANIGNLVIDCDYAIRWPNDWLLDFYNGETGEQIISSKNFTLHRYYLNGFYKDPLWRAKYPEMYEYYEYMRVQQRADSLMTDLRDNLLVYMKKNMNGRATGFPDPETTLVDSKYGRLENNYVIYDNPGFANRDAYDFQLSQEAADRYGIERIDMSTIGVPDLPKPARVSDNYNDPLRWTATPGDWNSNGSNAYGVWVNLPDDTEGLTMVSVFRQISPDVWQWDNEEALAIDTRGVHFIAFLAQPGETYTLFYQGDANYPPQFLGGKDGTSPPEDVLTFTAGTTLGEWKEFEFDLVKQRPVSELDNELDSITIDGVKYDGTPINVITDQVFQFSATVKNTGTASWGIKNVETGVHGSMLFSNNPEYNSTFGTYFINPGQGQPTSYTGDSFTYNAYLLAPSRPGNYTMEWRAKDCSSLNHLNSEWFGEVISVDFTVTQRAEQPPEPPAHVKGVVDASDFEYVGSFTLPQVPGITQGDEKSFFEGGIAMRTVDGEKRLLMATGTYQQTVYEVAIPDPVKIVGNDTRGIPVAPIRSVLGNIAKNVDMNGTMWYDDDAETLYWTNYDSYDTHYDLRRYPMLRSAKVVNGVLAPAVDWYFPPGTQMKAFWGGVTSIPKDFADQYANGRRLALGFGGPYSINAAASFGPSLAAASLPSNLGDELDLLPIFRHTINDRATRDGRYFGSYTGDTQPTSPWDGIWTSCDVVRSGVFIDLPDKKGYVTFARLATGRINYDAGGNVWDPHHENQWYFYDWETLGKAATGQIANTEAAPSSIATVIYPYDARAEAQYVTGSYFDPKTRLLYLYTLWGNNFQKNTLYDEPIIHVYRVTGKAAIAAAPLTGVKSPVEAATPSTAINNGDGFTATLSWDGNPPVFASGTVYTATIALTADEHHEFLSDLNSVAAIAGFTVNGSAPSAFVSNDGATLAFKVAFPQTTSGNETIAATRVWASGSYIHIASSTSGEAKIYNVVGQLVKTVLYLAGKTTATILPRGAYIVKRSDGWANKMVIQ